MVAVAPIPAMRKAVAAKIRAETEAAKVEPGESYIIFAHRMWQWADELERGGRDECKGDHEMLVPESLFKDLVNAAQAVSDGLYENDEHWWVEFETQNDNDEVETLRQVLERFKEGT
jgi:hypothetical protein